MAIIRRRIVLPGHGREEPEWPVIATVVLAILVGIAIHSLVVGRVKTFSAENVTLNYPATWNQARDRGALFAASDLSGGGLSGSRVSVHKVPRADLVRRDDASLAEAATAWTLRQARDLDNYGVLGM